MIDLSVKTSKIKLDFKPPNDPRFWQGLGLEVTKEIRKTTESGTDADGSRFKPYSAAYADYRASKGRSRTPTLSFTGRMLGAMARGIRATRDGVKIILSGEEGAKAWGNEDRGREFFNISTENVRRIAKQVDAWVTRTNRLK